MIYAYHARCLSLSESKIVACIACPFAPLIHQFVHHQYITFLFITTLVVHRKLREGLFAAVPTFLDYSYDGWKNKTSL